MAAAAGPSSKPASAACADQAAKRTRDTPTSAATAWHIGHGSQLETTMPPVRSASRAARIAATSACAVGSESRTVAFSQARRTASATSSSVVGVTGDKLP